MIARFLRRLTRYVVSGFLSAVASAKAVSRTRQRERELAGALRKLADAQRDQLTTLEGRIGVLADRIGQRATAKDANEILHAIRSLVREAEGEALRPDAKLYEDLDAIAKGSGPIVAGPWTGEVGFELLYWAPFLEWFRARWRLPAERFVIISRGGVESWYGMPGARYADIFSIMPPASFRARTDPDAHKQREVSELDRELVQTVTEGLGLKDAAHLHPRLMYRTFAPFWRDEAGFGLIQQFTSHRPMPPLGDPAAAGLPPEYVAARFYFNDGFPDTAANRALAQSIVEGIAQRIPVVMLDPGLRVDDHADYAPAAAPRVLSIAAGLAPERNLAVQSAVISRARAYVGTYGGYAYLAPFYGVPAIGFYSERAFKLHHLHVAQRVFERLGRATVMAIDTAHVHVARML